MKQVKQSNSGPGSHQKKDQRRIIKIKMTMRMRMRMRMKMKMKMKDKSN